jgi:hypothetical protein
MGTPLRNTSMIARERLSDSARSSFLQSASVHMQSKSIDFIFRLAYPTARP